METQIQTNDEIDRIQSEEWKRIRARAKAGEMIREHFEWTRRVPIYDPGVTARPIYDDGYGFAAAVIVTNADGFPTVEVNCESETGVIADRGRLTLDTCAVDTIKEMLAAIEPHMHRALSDWFDRISALLPEKEIELDRPRPVRCSLYDLIKDQLS